MLSCEKEMACEIPLNTLTREQKLEIVQDLTIRKKVNLYGIPKWQRNKIEEESAIKFFVSDGKNVRVPMRYAEKFYGKNPNQRIKIQKFGSFVMKSQLRDYQKEIVGKAMNMYMDTGCCFINVFCAYGKSFMGAYFSYRFSRAFQGRSLVVYHRKKIGDSWLPTFLNHTTAIVHVYDGKKEIPKDAQIILSMPSQVPKMSDEEKRSICHLVVDEAHRFCSQSSVEVLLSTTPQFLTLITATAIRSDGMHKMLDLVGGTEKITKISDKLFYVMKVNTGIHPPENALKRTKHGLNYSSLLKYLSNDYTRNSQIVEIVKNNNREKIMILTDLTSHVEILEPWIRKEIFPQKREVSSMYGTQDDYDDADVIIATYSKLGEGFDELAACRNWNGKRINMIILATSHKEPEQFAGRAFRADLPLIYDLVDDQKNIKNHYSSRKKWYISRNGRIINCDSSYVWRDHISEHLEGTSFEVEDTKTPFQSLLELEYG